MHLFVGISKWFEDDFNEILLKYDFFHRLQPVGKFVVVSSLVVGSNFVIINSKWFIQLEKTSNNQVVY
jgi:hypothetical protein